MHRDNDDGYCTPTETTLGMTPEQERLMQGMALTAAYYRRALLDQGLPDSFAKKLVRDWHAIQVSALFQSVPREEE